MLLAGITALVAFMSYEATFQSTTILESNSDCIVFKGVMPNSGDLVRTESQLIFNSLVLEPVLSEPGVRDAPELANRENAVANLRENLSVGNADTKTLLTISYESRDPKAAALVCNTVVDSYLRLRDQFDQKRVANLERWLTPEIERWEQEVQSHQHLVARLSE